MDKIKKKWPDNMELRNNINKFINGYNEIMERLEKMEQWKRSIMKLYYVRMSKGETRAKFDGEIYNKGQSYYREYF